MNFLYLFINHALYQLSRRSFGDIGEVPFRYVIKFWARSAINYTVQLDNQNGDVNKCVVTTDEVW